VLLSVARTGTDIMGSETSAKDSIVVYAFQMGSGRRRRRR